VMVEPYREEVEKLLDGEGNPRTNR